MTHRLLSLFILIFAALSLSAQKFTVKGTVINENDSKPFELATVRLLTADKQLIVGTFTDSLGNFTLKTDRKGNAIVYATFVGCEPAEKPITISQRSDTVDVGIVKLFTSDIALRSAVVSATAARVEQKEDTTVFNAAAYRTPDGATLEALVKQFPGIEITDDGKIKWNGKEIKEFLINGKDFFKGDTELAMKNLPVNLVSKIRAYDKKSDYAEQTGIDDGEENPVLDIMTKRELNQTLVSNIDLAGGWDWDSHVLYSGRVFATRFTDKSRITFFGNRNNTGNNGFGGPRGMGGGGGGNGITTTTMAGFDFNWENGIKRYAGGRVEIGGNLNYRGRDNESESTSSSENFMTNSTSKNYSNSHNWGESVSHNISSSLRFQWDIDSLTNLSFRPNYNWSRSNSSNRSRSASFDADPFQKIPGAEGTDDVLSAFDWLYDNYGPLTDEQQEKYQSQFSWEKNLNNNTKFSLSESHNVSGNLNITRRLTGKQGRNISLQANGGWSSTESSNYSLSNIYTRQAAPATSEGASSSATVLAEASVSSRRAPEASPSGYSLTPNGTHQFTLSPSKNWNVSVGGSYVEPIKGKWYGELRYNYSHRFQDTDHTLYNLYPLDAATREQLLEAYTGNVTGRFAYYHPQSEGVGSISDITEFNSTEALNQLLTTNEADLMAAIRDKDNSRYSTYKYDNQRISAGVRLNTQDANFNASVSFNPEHTSLHYDRPGLLSQPIDTVRTVFTVSPQVRFRYNFSKTNRLEAFYRGNSSQPSMTNLLPVVDTSNPLNISTGNPGLAPSWSDSFRLSYNGYNTNLQAGTMVNASFNNSRRSISTRQITDEMSGVRYSRPENISGSWSANGGLNYNIGLGRQKLFTLSTGTDLSYSTSVGFSSAKPAGIEAQRPDESTYDFMTRLFASVDNQKTRAQTTRVNENLNLAFRQTYWDISANGRMNYMHSVSDAKNAQTMDTWGFAYGLTGNVNLDCGFSVSTDIRMNSRRGYSEKSMNTNELIWNAQISQSFLKGKALTLQLQFYDILRQQSNISRNVTALSRSDSWNDAINSYFLVHVIYKLNLFNGSHANRSNEGERGPRGEGGRGGYGAPGQGGPGGGYRGGYGGPGGGYGGGNRF